MNSIVFLLPGLYDSGPKHWQTYWELEYGFQRIIQKDWEHPDCLDWTATVDNAITAHTPEKIILVAHSLGCCTVAHWSDTYKRQIKGALLVGPSDVDAPSYPPGTSGFMPMPLSKLPFPSIVLASSNDQYVTLPRAEYFAHAWGSRFVNIGDYGHINSASDLGIWPLGFEYLQQLDRTSSK